LPQGRIREFKIVLEPGRFLALLLKGNQTRTFVAGRGRARR
jgi:hypothetical protein